MYRPALPLRPPTALLTTAVLATVLATGLTAGAAVADSLPAADPDTRAAAVEARLLAGERTILTTGRMALLLGNPPPLPAGAVIGAGFIPGIPRLQVPALKETDASLGVAWALGERHDGATGLPSGLAMGATWNPALLREAGAMIGAEARAKGFNVMLAGGMNLVRDPRNGRAFEYLGEDPLHSGVLAGAAVSGIQSSHVISTVKHFAFNDQETGRMFVNASIADAAARESDLLAFEIAIEQGQPGAVMCAYNEVNGAHACSSDYLLNQVLKRDWGFRGWVMSDWGAVYGTEDALHGLDQQSAAELDREAFLDQPLARSAARDPAYAARLADMNRRILRSMYAVGIDAPPPASGIDLQRDGELAEAVAAEGIVLLRNRDQVLPLSPQLQRIAVIGGFADSGVLSGGGSSNVQAEGGPAITVPLTSATPFAAFYAQTYQRSVPLQQIAARAPRARIRYRDGRYLDQAVRAARDADVALVFATAWRTEGFDVPDLSLPSGQDALIAAVAAANPHTIVVLETGGPVMMPWLDRTAGVVEAWYPGTRGAEALAAILFGEVNPSGKLPVTFPASLAQLPRAALPGADTVEPDFGAAATPDMRLTADYDIEGSDVGYRWFARRGEQPLFPFGFGLSYTHFAYSDLQAEGGAAPAAHFTVVNTGARAGLETAQLYLVDAPQGRRQRLLGWQKLQLKSGERGTAVVRVDRRLLADFDSAAHAWRLAAGRYTLAAGPSAAELPLRVTIQLDAARLAP